MKQYDYILLDWDGNIARTIDLVADARGEALQKRGITLTKSQLVESCSGFVDYTTKLTDITVEEATKVLGESFDLLHSRLIQVELYADALDVLTKLNKSGKHLALVTTSQRRLIIPVLKRYNLTNLFKAIITDDDIEKPYRKPHPKSLHMALERMGGMPERAIMVGDRDKDIVGGCNAGMDSVLFCSIEHQQHYSFEKLMEYRPTYVISAFRDLLKVIEGVHAPAIHE